MSSELCFGVSLFFDSFLYHTVLYTIPFFSIGIVGASAAEQGVRVPLHVRLVYIMLGKPK